MKTGYAFTGWLAWAAYIIVRAWPLLKSQHAAGRQLVSTSH
jgi:hypothetical protein